MNMPRLDPRLCAAALVLAVVTAGAVSGSAIGSTPMLQRSVASHIPEAPPNAGVGDFKLDTRKRPPDHYPLVTPTGTIPVAALASHGRLRDRRGGWGDQPDAIPLAATYADELAEDEVDRLARWQPAPRRTVPVAVQISPPRVTVARGAERGEQTYATSPAPEVQSDPAVQQQDPADPSPSYPAGSR
ncbi:MAG: hypothetical protein JJ901_04180 [Erythrobacter sp.]|uniref:hypothetical protein n=1 Tax=Erythrobacter sp. TaxID=1042 RepID=UPI001B2B67EA|nr:hypothetical protein [Erythrobacter sp.]MBO6767490.1 hypothetical protein [Erythrobacter sp.]